MNTQHNIGVAAQIGTYSDAVEVSHDRRWLFTAGTPGLLPNGTLPEGIAAQSELAWKHIVTLLDRAGMTVNDLVRVTQYLTRESDIAEYARVRSCYLGKARPASTLLVVSALARPEFLVEIEILATKN